MRKIKYSSDVDAFLIELSDQPIEYAEEAGGVIIHFSKEGKPVLLEVLDAHDLLLSMVSGAIKRKEVVSP